MAVVDFYRGYLNDLVGRLRSSYLESRQEDRNREADIISAETGSDYFIDNFMFTCLLWFW